MNFVAWFTRIVLARCRSTYTCIAAGSHELVQGLKNASMKAAITIALTRCRALGKDKYPFNKGVAPNWWPAEVPFTVVSEQKQSGLRLLMLRLLSLAEDECMIGCTDC